MFICCIPSKVLEKMMTNEKALAHCHSNCGSEIQEQGHYLLVRNAEARSQPVDGCGHLAGREVVVASNAWEPPLETLWKYPWKSPKTRGRSSKELYG